MLTMLDQAVIDAASLKEAALKNAEAIVLEKYAPELKEALNSILEIEEDPLSIDVSDSDIGNGSSVEDPMTTNLPMAAMDGETACPCPDEDEEIEIDFDQLTQMSQDQDIETDLPGQQGELSPEVDETLVQEDDAGIMIPSSLGTDVLSYSSNPGDPISKVGQLALAAKPVPSDILDSAISNLEGMKGNNSDPEKLNMLISQLKSLAGSSQLENEIESPMENNHYDLTEEILETILSSYDDISEEKELDESNEESVEESLEVNLHNVPTGHIGQSTFGEEVEASKIELARLQDDKVAEENKQLQKSIKDLKENIKSLQLENNKFKGIAIQAGKKLQELNSENAKLMYSNRVLKSDSLNERQKTKFVEAISKVGSVNDAKVVFETLQGWLDVNNNNILPKTLTETINKDNFFTIQTRTTENSDPLKDRMQKLAGIKNK